jgi:phenylacetate-CoA ligase
MVKLWGSFQDILRGGQGFEGYLRQQLSGVTILNSDRMTEKNEYQYVQRINNIKPCLILAFTNSIDELARFIQEHHLSIYSPHAIMTTAGVLYPEVRSRIEKVFRTTIFNRYGSQEVSDIACNCEKDQGLHLIPDIHYLEIVDEKGKEVKPGESGEIIITLLTNYTMPLIRYKIGDRGILSDKNNQCGRGLPLLEKVEGRIRSNFKNKFGDHINGGVFIDLFHFRENIKQFQIIQETVDSIVINLVLIDKTNLKDMDKDFKEINKKIWKIMGHKTNVNYNIVDEIEPSPSGKYMYSFSRVKK